MKSVNDICLTKCRASAHALTILKAFLTVTIALTLVSGCSFFKDSDNDDNGTKKDGKAVLVQIGLTEITIYEFNRSVERLLPENPDNLTPESLLKLKQSLLTQIIDEELIVHDARRKGLQVSTAELEEELRAIKDEYGDTRFNAAILSRYGTIEKWEAEIKKKLLIKKLINNIRTTEVEVTEKEALRYYNANIPKYEMPDQVHARMIVVGTEKEAREIRETLTAENFFDVARKRSMGLEAKDGGDLGTFGMGDMPPEFEEVVFKIEPGTVSKVIKTPYGFHIFLVEEKIKGRKLEFEDARGKIIEKLKIDKAEQKFSELIMKLRKETVIEVKSELM